MTDTNKESHWQDLADLRAENAKLRASYEKLKGMLLRRQERDNDLDKAQIEELTVARNKWDTQVSFQEAAKDGSAMRAVIDASERLVALLERNYAIVVRANERVVAERDSKTHSEACVFCDWKGPDRTDWIEANADVAEHDCKQHPYRLALDKAEAELAALRKQSEAAPSDAEIEAWRRSLSNPPNDWVDQAVALMRRTRAAPAPSAGVAEMQKLVDAMLASWSKSIERKKQSEVMTADRAYWQGCADAEATWINEIRRSLAAALAAEPEPQPIAVPREVLEGIRAHIETAIDEIDGDPGEALIQLTEARGELDKLPLQRCPGTLPAAPQLARRAGAK